MDKANAHIGANSIRMTRRRGYVEFHSAQPSAIRAHLTARFCSQSEKEPRCYHACESELRIQENIQDVCAFREPKWNYYDFRAGSCA
jgi:hypothetical protein